MCYTDGSKLERASLGNTLRSTCQPRLRSEAREGSKTRRSRKEYFSQRLVRLLVCPLEYRNKQAVYHHQVRPGSIQDCVQAGQHPRNSLCLRFRGPWRARSTFAALCEYGQDLSHPGLPLVSDLVVVEQAIQAQWQAPRHENAGIDPASLAC